MRNYTKIYDQADDLVQDSGECTRCRSLLCRTRFYPSVTFTAARVAPTPFEERKYERD